MYKAKIIRAQVFEPIPDADRIEVLVYNGMRFVVGKGSIQPGDLVCLFPADGQLSHDFCYHNNLYRHAHLNKDISIVGYFDDNRRVRAQPFRGVKSEGFVCTLGAFSYITDRLVAFEENEEFDTVLGKLICEKFVTEATKQAIAKLGKQKSRGFLDVDYGLRKHFDTGQLDYALNGIPEERSLVVITEKLHGTSGRTGNVLVKRARFSKFGSFVNGLFKKRIVKPIESAEYEYVTGTRNTIVNDRTEMHDPHHSEYFRWQVHQDLIGKLHKGETIFYEIVGRNTNNAPIMDAHNPEKLQNKDIKKAFGDSISYLYGCNDYEHAVYVYRITYQNEDGIVFEMPYLDMVRRANEIGLDAVPLLDAFYWGSDSFGIEVFHGQIMHSVSQLLRSGLPSTLDTRHIREGVCVRIESRRGYSTFKKKTFEFLVMEGIAKEKSDSVDLEEAS